VQRVASGPAAPGPRAFRRGLALRRLPLCPEIQLWLLGDDVDLEEECRELHEAEAPPYWAFCWGSGQALARFLLDHPAEVRDRRVVDLGTGSGVVAIAAAQAGARSVWAIDSDPAALRAARTNAAINCVALEVGQQPPDAWDVLVASDILYEAETRDRLLSLADRSLSVLVSDPERPSSPRLGIAPLIRLDARTVPDVDSPIRTAAIFRLPSKEAAQCIRSW
jgi:predicted nicotinamide N-methyase